MKSYWIHKPEDFFPSLRWEAEVDNLLNNDMYKFTMLDFILAHPEYKWIPVRWKMTVRSKDVKTCEVIPYEILDNQFRKTQESINGVSQADLSFLRWMTKSDGSPFFREETLSFLSILTPKVLYKHMRRWKLWNTVRMTLGRVYDVGNSMT